MKHPNTHTLRTNKQKTRHHKYSVNRRKMQAFPKLAGSHSCW